MHDAASVRLSVSREWWGAAATIVLASLLTTQVVREFRVARTFVPTPAAIHGAASAAAIPADAVSISTLHVEGRTVRVGDRAAAAVASLGAPAVLRHASEDVGPAGRRQIRAYDVDGASVTVVLEPFEPQGALRVAAIYLH